MHTTRILFNHKSNKTLSLATMWKEGEITILNLISPEAGSIQCDLTHVLYFKTVDEIQKVSGSGWERRQGGTRRCKVSKNNN